MKYKPADSTRLGYSSSFGIGYIELACAQFFHLHVSAASGHSVSFSIPIIFRDALHLKTHRAHTLIKGILPNAVLHRVPKNRTKELDNLSGPLVCVRSERQKYFRKVPCHTKPFKWKHWQIVCDTATHPLKDVSIYARVISTIRMASSIVVTKFLRRAERAVS